MMEIPGAVIRLETGFGDVSGFDKISGEYFTLSAGVDTTALLGSNCVIHNTQER